MLLELVTGREANSVNESMSLVQKAWQNFSEGDKSIIEILDPEVKESCCLEAMIMVYKVGIVCTRASPSIRPSMKEVLHVLQRWCPEDGWSTKRVGSEFDIAPLLGCASAGSGAGAGAGATYFSSYRNSEEGSEGRV